MWLELGEFQADAPWWHEARFVPSSVMVTRGLQAVGVSGVSDDDHDGDEESEHDDFDDDDFMMMMTTSPMMMTSPSIGKPCSLWIRRPRP